MGRLSVMRQARWTFVLVGPVQCHELRSTSLARVLRVEFGCDFTVCGCASVPYRHSLKHCFIEQVQHRRDLYDGDGGGPQRDRGLGTAPAALAACCLLR